MQNNIGTYFYTFIIGFCFGVASEDILKISLYTLAFVLILSLAFFAFGTIHKKIKKKEIGLPITLVSLFLIACAVGGLRMHQIFSNENALPLNQYEGANAMLVGRVMDDLGNNKITLDVFAVADNNIPKNIDDEKIILDNMVGVFGYNDTLVIKGKVDRPQNFDTKDGRVFDYVTYLKKQGIIHSVSFGSIVEHKKNDETTLRTILYAIKNTFTSNVESLISPPESSLATGVTIAGKGALPKEVQNDFVNAGIIHIVVLSGYNIAIVIRAMMSLFGMWGRRFGIMCAGIGIVLFVIMTGGSAPVVRSAIMAAITLFGTLSYKNVLQNRALFGAAFLMILLNPYSLLYDASFALSVLATCAIINCTLPLKALLAKTNITEKFKIREILSETLATQIVVLPYLLYEIGNLSIVAPISNIIVLPLIPLIMLLTFIVGVLGFIPFVTLPFAGLLIVLSSFVIWIAHVLASIPFGYFKIQYFPLWAMVLCYLGYFALWLWIEKKRGSGMEKVANTAEPY